MKLLVCDIEGTIFQPCMIKSAQHASYIWTAIAEALGREAEHEEINTQRKWRNGDYGAYNSGIAYMRWVNESIEIHHKYKLTRRVFDDLIELAPYVQGVQQFFRHLNREEYIPVFISGGIQNLNYKACRDLGVDTRDSYAACEYFFNERGHIDRDLTFQNTCNFYGKYELIQIALRKYNLGKDDWVFIGDGVNDVDTAQKAPFSIGIAPIAELKEVVDLCVADFDELLRCEELLEKFNLVKEANVDRIEPMQEGEELYELAQNEVAFRVGHLKLQNYEKRAYKAYRREIGDEAGFKLKNRFTGVEDLLVQGELILQSFQRENVDTIASAALQPFCSATEIMVNIAFALTGNSEQLQELFARENNLKKAIDRVDNPSLREVLHTYRKNRNLIAHAYQPLPVEAAKALVNRTYENIQRLELILNPL